MKRHDLDERHLGGPIIADRCVEISARLEQFALALGYFDNLRATLADTIEALIGPSSKESLIGQEAVLEELLRVVSQTRSL